MAQIKRTFVGLMLLADMWKEDAEWQANLRSSGVVNGYTFANEDEGDGNEVLQDFACDELEFVEEGTVQVFDFMGSAEGRERFYPRDLSALAVYKDKETGGLWVLHHENIYNF